ncbi:HAMP domain-containing protein [Candidatus Pacearchaeota archaeon]|nr:HAMP domain-containing protein [Candidatus Pacearchaeota archaeon]
MVKLSIIILIISTLAFALLGSFEYKYDSKELKKDLINRLESTSKRLSISLDTPLYTFQDQGIRDIILSEISDPEIIGIFVIENSKINSSYGYAKLEDKIIESKTFPEKSNNILQIKNTISHKEESLGEVYVFITTNVLKQKLKSELITHAIQIIIINISITILLIALLKIMIISPLNTLQKATSQISKGNLNQNIQIKSKDEIGDLANTFQEMTNKLKISRKQLQDANKNLELKIKQRTSELQNKNKEYERMNKFMLGRENEMVKLKEQIKKLKENKK